MREHRSHGSVFRHGSGLRHDRSAGSFVGFGSEPFPACMVA
jgi:hypothetical protein